MRKSKKETAETHCNIVKSASAQFKSKGIAATGLSEVMAEAGLTHGGFYKHFDSKDQLIAEALQLSIDALADRLEDLLRNGSKDSEIERLVKQYLSQEHRDHPETGCPIAGIGIELARAEPNTRRIATDGVRRLIDLFKSHLGSPSSSESRMRATASVSMLIGALTLSRVVNDEKLSNDLLKAATAVAVNLNH